MKINAELRIQVVNLMNNGCTQSNTARQLNLGQPTVRKIWLRYLETGSTENKPKSGRPRKITEKERRRLSYLCKVDPFKTPKQLINEIDFSQSVSLWTVRRELNRCGLLARSAAKKPLLSKVNIKKRLDFCRSYAQFSKEQWRNVIFSDESQFKMFSTRRTIVRRPVGTRFCNRYVTKTVKYGGVSILVWGAIRGDGSRILLRCPHKLDSLEYQSILNQGLLNICGSHNTFMQDGAPCHKSRSTLQYLDNNGICLLSDWPPQSPDINIIENLWSIIKYKVSKYYTKSAEDLWNVIQKEWLEIDNTTLFKLYDSIPHRLKQICANKGHHCNY